MLPRMAAFLLGRGILSRYGVRVILECGMRLDGGVAELPTANLAREKVFHLVGVVWMKDPPGDLAGIERLVGIRRPRVKRGTTWSLNR